MQQNTSKAVNGLLISVKESRGFPVPNTNGINFLINAEPRDLLQKCLTACWVNTFETCSFPLIIRRKVFNYVAVLT